MMKYMHLLPDDLLINIYKEGLRERLQEYEWSEIDKDYVLWKEYEDKIYAMKENIDYENHCQNLCRCYTCQRIDHFMKVQNKYL